MHPLGGHGPPTWALFGENVCENERIGSHWGEHVPGMPPPPYPPMKCVNRLIGSCYCYCYSMVWVEERKIRFKEGIRVLEKVCLSLGYSVWVLMPGSEFENWA